MNAKILMKIILAFNKKTFDDASSRLGFSMNASLVKSLY